MRSSILHDCGRELALRRLTVACAESVTAGRLAAELALLPQSGQILKGGLVCYDAEVKQIVLGIPKEMIERFSPESAEISAELAVRLSQLIPADIHIGVTGLSAPGGSETKDKLVGTMFLNVLIDGHAHAVRQVFSGDPEQIILQAIDRVAQMLIDIMESDKAIKAKSFAEQ